FSDLRYASKNKASILLTEGRAILTKGVIHDKRKIQKKRTQCTERLKKGQNINFNRKKEPLSK
ncbi:hypothetical protein ABMX71_24030, partial [Vibrio vulnificus]|uniref:hypothetical protein n=1 Tax=Vibrio vulnificus TaxID=672 RepID=UPI00405933B1